MMKKFFDLSCSEQSLAAAASGWLVVDEATSESASK